MSTTDALRSPAAFRRYHEHLKDRKGKDLLHLVQKAKWRGKYWFIAPNEYPYDRVAVIHDLLIPFRVFEEPTQMRIAEADELRRIKAKAGDLGYDSIMENTHPHRSVDAHFHVHLVAFRT